MLAMEPEEGRTDRFPILVIRRRAGCSCRVGPSQSREEYLFFLLQVPSHVACNLLEDGGDPDHFGVVSPMHRGNLAGIGSNLLVILLEIDMVVIDDIVS